MKDEYKKAHDNIWPEYAKAVRDAGIVNQSIFYKPDGTVIIYFESSNPEKSLEKIAKNPLNIKWQKEMGKFIAKSEESKTYKSLKKESPVLKEFRPEVEIQEQVFYRE